MAWLAPTALLVLGCGDPADPVETTSADLIGGRLESGYRATGFLKVHFAGDDPSATYNCTATLIRSDAILTAAHCFKSPKHTNRWDSARFYLGDFRSPERTLYLRKTIVHPRFTGSGTNDDMGNDLAVGFLTQQVTGIEIPTLASTKDER